MLGKFVDDQADGSVSTDDGFHSIRVTATVAGKLQTHWHPETSVSTVQDGKLRKAAGADWDPSAFNLASTPVRERLPVSVVAAGAENVTASVVVQCNLTDEGFDAWRQTVYDALVTAHEQAVREYRDEQARLALRRASSLRERSPARHTELISDELRRLVIAWLTDESPFGGRPAVHTKQSAPKAEHADEHSDVEAVLATAPEIQFLEQAFEWQNLVYVCYPFYWATPWTWDERRTLDAGDARLAQFLRAGSVRVVVPARAGFQEAVAHWLAFRQPWAGGPVPQPQDPLYVSIAQEIRDQLLAPDDGVPGESWEARLPTNFRWLDDKPTLPHNDKAVLGAEPNRPKVVLCGDMTGSAEGDGAMAVDEVDGRVGGEEHEPVG